MATLLLLLIALGGGVLQITILGRCLWKGTWKTYPFFYFQLIYSLLATLVLGMVVLVQGAPYEKWYWIGECSTMFIGCGNILEILRHEIAQSPAAKVFIRTVRILLGLSLSVFISIYLYGSIAWESYHPFVLVERNFRLVQAALLLTILGAVFYLGIRLNRNIRGI